MFISLWMDWMPRSALPPVPPPKIILFEKECQNNKCFKIISKLIFVVLSSEFIKIVIINYDFKLKVKIVIDNYDFNYLKKF